MRRRCWLIKRVTWQSCIHHSQAEQKSTHASLSTLFLLCLISAFSYPYMAANACSVCLEKRENGRWCCYTPYILDTSSTLHLLLFSVAQMQYPIAHTLVSLIPKATWNMIVKHCVTPQSWSKLKYSSIPHKHARLIRPWSGLWDTTIQNLSLTHSHSSTPDSNNLFIPWEKVSIATPHPSSRSMSSGTRWEERAWHSNFFHLQNIHTSIYCFKTSLHKHIQPYKLIFLRPLRNVVIQMSLFSLFI